MDVLILQIPNAIKILRSQFHWIFSADGCAFVRLSCTENSLSYTFYEVHLKAPPHRHTYPCLHKKMFAVQSHVDSKD